MRIYAGSPIWRQSSPWPWLFDLRVNTCQGPKPTLLIYSQTLFLLQRGQTDNERPIHAVVDNYKRDWWCNHPNPPCTDSVLNTGALSLHHHVITWNKICRDKTVRHETNFPRPAKLSVYTKQCKRGTRQDTGLHSDRGLYFRPHCMHALVFLIMQSFILSFPEKILLFSYYYQLFKNNYIKPFDLFGYAIEENSLHMTTSYFWSMTS